MLSDRWLPAAGGWLLLAALSRPAAAQTPLTLPDAMAMAAERAPAARALTSAAREADARVQAARAGYFPRVDVVESAQRGNQPVYVFSSLLSERQFTADRFDIRTLNEPAALTSTQTAFSVEQTLFDGGRTHFSVRMAQADGDLARLDRTRGLTDLRLAAAQAFVQVLQLDATERAVASSVAAAESDLDRARARRDAGLATDADVLAMQVHLADVEQRQTTTRGAVRVARLQLNEVLGVPLDEPFTLVSPTQPAPASGETEAALVQAALQARPERRQAELRVTRAANAAASARAALLPSVSAQGAWTFAGERFGDQRAGWLVGAQVRLNLFSGFADTARLAEARAARERAEADREQQARRIEVDVRAAAARLEAARAAEAAGRAALQDAAASQRIIRDRYDTGLATITDVLRASEAVLDAESRATAARMDVILQSIALDRAVGRL